LATERGDMSTLAGKSLADLQIPDNMCIDAQSESEEVESLLPSHTDATAIEPAEDGSLGSEFEGREPFKSKKKTCHSLL
jgi:hypothetical protein